VEFLKNLQGFRTGEKRDEILEALDSAFIKNSPVLRVKSYFDQMGNLNVRGKIIVIGFGKAARGMWEGAQLSLGARITSARLIVPAIQGEEISYPFLPGDHPLPSSQSLSSSAALINSLKGLSRDDLVIVLISGGGSSLFEVLREGVRLEEYNNAIGCLMRSGATIRELNSIRYLFSETKGGGLLKYTNPSRVMGIIISDVPGDDARTVASGPTTHPPEESLIDRTIRKFGQKCNIPSTGKVKRNESYEAENHVILKNSDFVKSVEEKLKMNGSEVLSLGSGIEGSTSKVSKRIATVMRTHYEIVKVPFFIVGGGETSSEVVGNGNGGRNLELCLRFLMEMGKGENFTFGSFGTDGMDGSSKAMGAIVDNHSCESLDRGFIGKMLSRSESLAPLRMTEDVIFTGPTGTNVADVFIGYYAGTE
jgi:glycerate 2-kinase